MQIIVKDNYDRETHSDFVIATNVNEFNGKRIVKLLNDNGPDYYVLVDDDYELYIWKP